MEAGPCTSPGGADLWGIPSPSRVPRMSSTSTTTHRLEEGNVLGLGVLLGGALELLPRVVLVLGGEVEGAWGQRESETASEQVPRQGGSGERGGRAEAKAAAPILACVGESSQRPRRIGVCAVSGSAATPPAGAPPSAPTPALLTGRGAGAVALVGLLEEAVELELLVLGGLGGPVGGEGLDDGDGLVERSGHFGVWWWWGGGEVRL